MDDRVILHCDCNSFFASVETVLNPAYRDVPMAVCGSTDDRHGIVLAKNELAKKYGIATAETVYSARKKCPELVIARPHHGEYVKYSATSSIGATVYPRDAKDYHGLYTAADSALYEAKRQGKNRMVFYNKDLEIITPDKKKVTPIDSDMK